MIRRWLFDLWYGFRSGVYVLRYGWPERERRPHPKDTWHQANCKQCITAMRAKLRPRPHPAEPPPARRIAR